MTRKQLNTIRARVEAATPGPWEVDGETCDEDGNPVPMPWGLEGPQGMLWSSGAGEYAHPDYPTATFIAKVREDVPALLAEVERLAQERDAATDKALRFDLDATGIQQRESEAIELVERRAEVERLNEEVRRLGKFLDVCEVVHTHNVKLKEQLTAAQAEVERLTAERDAAFKRGVAAMREAAVDACRPEYPDAVRRLRALPDPEDTP